MINAIHFLQQGPQFGAIIHITTRRASNATAGDSGSREKAEPKTLAEKRAGLESRRIALIIVEKLSPALAESKLPIPGGDPLNATKDSFYLRLAAAFGAELIAGGELEDELLGGWRHFDDTEKTDANELHEQIWALAKHGLEKSVEFYKPTDLGEDVMLAAKRLAWLLGLKWIELLQFAVEQIKEPKSWATDHPDKCACAQCEVQRTATKPEKI